MKLQAIYEYTKDYLLRNGVDVSFQIDDASLVVENDKAKVKLDKDKARSLSHIRIALRPLMEDL